MRYRNGLLYPNKVEPPFRGHLRDHESKYPLISCALKQINDFSGQSFFECWGSPLNGGEIKVSGPTKVSLSPELRGSFNRGNKYKDMWTFFTRNKFSEWRHPKGEFPLYSDLEPSIKTNVLLYWYDHSCWPGKLKSSIFEWIFYIMELQRHWEIV